MANEQNLISPEELNARLTPEQRRENTSKAGIASGKARREKRDRYQRMKMTLDLLVNDPKTLQKLKDAGVDDTTGITYEEAAEIMQAVKAAREGDTNAFKAVKEEAYGKLDNKTQLEVSGEVTGININVKNYSKGDK